MGSMTSGQKQSKKFTQQAVGALTAGQQQMLSNPLFMAGQQLAMEYAKNPTTFNPQLIAQLRALAADQQASTARATQQQVAERAGATGSYRSGMTGEMQRRVAQQQGQGIADAYRQIETQAAMQRPADYQNALAMMNAVLGPQYQWDRDIANAYVGAAGNQVWQQASPWASFGTGVGNIFGSLVGRKQGFLGI